MSTRCQISVKGSPILIYKHSDGYPEGMLPTLQPFIKAFTEARGNDVEYCLAQIIREFALQDFRQETLDELSSSYRFTGWGIDTVVHGDIEYFYVVDPAKGTVTVHTRDFEMAHARGET